MTAEETNGTLTPEQKRMVIDLTNMLTTNRVPLLVAEAERLCSEFPPDVAIQIVVESHLSSAISLYRSAIDSGHLKGGTDADLRAFFNHLLKLPQAVSERRPDGTYSPPQSLN